MSLGDRNENQMLPIGHNPFPPPLPYEKFWMERQVKITSDKSQPDRSEDIVLSRCGNTDRHVDFVPSEPGTRSSFQGTPFWRIEACGPVGELWR